MLMRKWQGRVVENRVRWMMFLPSEGTICCSPSPGHYDTHPSQVKTALIPSLKNLSVSLHYGLRSKSRILLSKSGQGENEALWVDSWLQLSKISA